MKNILKKIMSLLLALTLSLPFFAACAPAQDNPPVVDPGGDNGKDPDGDKDPEVNPNAPITALTLYVDQVTIPVGKTRKIDVKTVTPETSKQNVEWSSSSSARVEVSADGVISAKRAGEGIVITAKDKNSQTAANCTVTVVEGDELLETAYEAIGGLEAEYAKYKTEDYSARGQAVLLQIKAEACSNLEAARSESAINKIKEDAVAAMSEVKTLAQEREDGVFVNYLSVPVDMNPDGSMKVNGLTSGWLRSGLTYTNNTGMDEFVWTSDISTQQLGVYSVTSGVRLRFAFLDGDGICQYGFCPTFDGDKESLIFERVSPFFFEKIGPGGDFTLNSKKAYTIVITRSLIGDESGTAKSQRLVFEAYEKISETEKTLVATKIFEDSYTGKLVPSYGVENVVYTIHSAKVNEVDAADIATAKIQSADLIDAEAEKYERLTSYYATEQLTSIRSIAEDAKAKIGSAKYLGDISSKEDEALQAMANVVPQTIPAGYTGAENAVVDEEEKTITFTPSTAGSTAVSKARHGRENTWDTQVSDLSGKGSLNFNYKNGMGSILATFQLQIEAGVGKFYYGNEKVADFDYLATDTFRLRIDRVAVPALTYMRKNAVALQVSFMKNDGEIYNGTFVYEGENDYCQYEYHAVGVSAVVAYAEVVMDNSDAARLATQKLALSQHIEKYSLEHEVYGSNDGMAETAVKAAKTAISGAGTREAATQAYHDGIDALYAIAENSAFKNNGKALTVGIENGNKLNFSGSFDQSVITKRMDYTSFRVTVDIPALSYVNENLTQEPKRVVLSINNYNITLHYKGENRASSFCVGTKNELQLSRNDFIADNTKSYRVIVERQFVWNADFEEFEDGLYFYLYELNADGTLGKAVYAPQAATKPRPSNSYAGVSLAYQQHNMANSGEPTVITIERLLPHIGSEIVNPEE